MTKIAEILEEQQAEANCRNYGTRRRRSFKHYEIAWDMPPRIWRGLEFTR